MPNREGRIRGTRIGWTGLLLAVSLAGCGRPPAPMPPASALSAPPVAPDPIRAADPLLAERMESLTQRSAIWRAGLDTIRANGFRVLVAAPEQVRRMVPELEGYRTEHFGEVLPLRDEAGALIGAVVSVDVPRLERLFLAAGLPASILAGDVDRILIHEVYGHVVPLSVSRQLSGGCPDPAPEEPALSSCAIRRENRIRAELGLEPRTAYDIRGLTIGRILHAEDI